MFLKASLHISVPAADTVDIHIPLEAAAGGTPPRDDDWVFDDVTLAESFDVWTLRGLLAASAQLSSMQHKQASGQLSLLPSVGWETSTGQNTLMLNSQEVKAGMAPYTPCPKISDTPTDKLV